MAAAYVASALNVLTSFVSLRLLGPTSIGLYQTGLIVKQYALYANAGDTEAVRKEGGLLAGRTTGDDLDRFFGRMLGANLLTLAVVLPLIMAAQVLVLRLEGPARLTLLAVSAVFALEYLQYFYGNAARVLHDFRAYGIGTIAAALMGLLGLALVPRFGYGGFLTGKVAAVAAAVLVMGAAVGRRARPTFRDIPWGMIVRTGIPLNAIGLLTVFFTTADRLAVSTLLGSTALGLYSLAGFVGLPVLLLAQATASVLFTGAANALGADTPVARILADIRSRGDSIDRIATPVLHSLLLLLPLAVQVALPAYAGGVVAAQLALGGLAFHALAQPYLNLLLLADAQRQLAALLTAGGLFVLAAAKLAAPTLGLTGIAGVMVLAHAGIATGAIVLAHRAAGERLVPRDAWRLLGRAVLLLSLSAAIVLTRTAPLVQAVLGITLGLACLPTALALLQRLRTARSG